MQDKTWLNIYSLIQVYQVFVKLEDIYLFTVELQNHLEEKYFKSLTGKLSTLQTSGNFTCYFQLHPQLCCVLCICKVYFKRNILSFQIFKASHIVSREEILLAEKSFYFLYDQFDIHPLLHTSYFAANKISIKCSSCLLSMPLSKSNILWAISLHRTCVWIVWSYFVKLLR